MRSHFSHEIQFVKYRRVFFTISIVLILLAIVGVIVRGVNLGVEFKGGTQVACTGLTAPKDADRVEYRMLIAGADGSWEVARDWAADGDFLYERSERGTFDIRVEARMVGSNGDFERYRELTLYH